MHGVSAHSSAPWQGKNAIDGAVAVLRAVEGVRPEGEHPHLGRATITPTAIRSFPEATHTVPDEVRIVLDRRLLPGDDPELALDELRRACANVPGWEVEVEPGPLMYPSELQEDAPFVRLLHEAFADAGSGASLLRSHGAIDAGFFNERGIPAVMLGPGEQSQWHTDDESVALADVSLVASVYASAALRALA